MTATDLTDRALGCVLGGAVACQPEVTAEALCRAVAEDIQPFHPGFADLVVGLPAQLDGDRAAALE